MTEHHCNGTQTAGDSIGLAAFAMDSHNCRRFSKGGRIWNEGDVQVHPGPPYPISYPAVVPKTGECINLFVPFCLSTTHLAFGSIRMEPVLMILAESFVHASKLAIQTGASVQSIDYPRLQEILVKAEQVLGNVTATKDTQAGE